MLIAEKAYFVKVRICSYEVRSRMTVVAKQCIMLVPTVRHHQAVKVLWVHFIARISSRTTCNKRHVTFLSDIVNIQVLRMTVQLTLHPDWDVRLATVTSSQGTSDKQCWGCSLWRKWLPQQGIICTKVPWDYEDWRECQGRYNGLWPSPVPGCKQDAHSKGGSNTCQKKDQKNPDEL